MIADVDAQITELFRQHDSADVLHTMLGFGPVLAATFLANICGNLEAFDSVDRLASVPGLAPVPRDSGGSAATFTDHVKVLWAMLRDHPTYQEPMHVQPAPTPSASTEEST